MTDKPPVTINSIADIQALVRAGFQDWARCGDVTVRPGGAAGDLLIFNYTDRAQYRGEWNFFEQVSRGLIINATSGEIVARAFDKFFNWQENGRHSDGQIVTITEKLDGSLGVLYRDQGRYTIATRGSLRSEQSAWATRFLQENYPLADLPDELTLIFEILYPENRIIVDYHGRRDLVLLAARNRHIGTWLPFAPAVTDLAARYGFALPKVYPFADLSEIIGLLGTLDTSEEGYVVEFSDGQRFKFKGSRYLELSRLISGLSYKSVLRAMAGGVLETLLQSIPEEFLDQTRGWVAEIEQARETLRADVIAAFDAIPAEARTSRKAFALWVNRSPTALTPFLFAMLDQDDLTPLLYRTLLNRPDPGALSGS